MKEVVLASYNECTGCGACASVCHKDAIIFDYDKNGFLRPSINKEKCVSCGMCTKACPALHQNEIERSNPHTYTCYTAWTIDDELAKKCSSGGFSTQLMMDFLKGEKSIVYGAAMSNHNTCSHIAATSIEELQPIMGTKYIQSDASWALKEVKLKLKDGWRVLFTGTPCQISALYLSLGRTDTTNLFTIELICHGAPSKLCTDYTCLYYNADSIITHRSKKNGWYYENKKQKALQLHSHASGVFFVDGKSYFSTCCHNFLNPTCYHCKYARPERMADLTIGDQWGLAPKYPGRALLGASSVIACTSKGKELLESLKNMNSLHIEENPMSTINAPNIFHPTKKFLGPWLANHAYIAKKLPLKYAFAFLSLNYKKLWCLFPLRIIMRIGNRNNKQKSKLIIDNIRKKYNWL